MWKRSIFAAKIGINHGKEERLGNRERLAGIGGV
jgi:hypothetical protein